MIEIDQAKTTISDYSIPRRIFYIFQRATRKFKGDLGLWVMYIEYMKREKARKLLGKVFAT